MGWISIIFSAFALIISAVVGYITWKNRDESRKARDYSVMARIIDTVDNDKAREDRNYIYTLVDKGHLDFKNIPKILDQIGRERVHSIERTINALDNVGFFLKTGYSSYSEAPQGIWQMANAMWERLEPFINHFRTQPGRQKGYAEYFEQMAKEALKHLKTTTK
ncbi:MAG: hypothetical protein FJ023_03840 [Chloroflexi bacterium]|nr:hypothetical protein [Chloroflexota bacterium]